MMITALHSGWNTMFGTVTEYFFEVHSYHIYFQNICHEHRPLYTAEGTISMQEL